MKRQSKKVSDKVKYVRVGKKNGEGSLELCRKDFGITVYLVIPFSIFVFLKCILVNKMMAWSFENVPLIKETSLKGISLDSHIILFKASVFKSNLILTTT